jgi:EAL domain-containing protein (putative c-di-GMP-specific phosphodiesterase class I)
MRAAKEQGRNCFVAYKESHQQTGGARLLLESGNAFLRALKDNRVRLAFQPIISTAKENVSFHECLIRMVDENGKLHSAAQFIPAVEKLGLGHLVDQFALRAAIQELTMFPDLNLSVNVSNLSLTHQDWLRGLVAALKDRPSVAQRLIIEITENTMMGDLDRTLRVIGTLRDLGCRVALDDFGAGSTAFSQLNQLDIDMVKIDKSFVRNISRDHNHLFVRTLQTLAEGIDVETVGEGAETANDARTLAGDGINYIQGYVYGFPQIERVWLPKDHAYRQVASDGSLPEAASGDSLSLVEALEADIIKTIAAAKG